MGKATTLILAPHMDDEVLGCASFLYSDAVVVYTTRTHPLYPEVAREQKAVARAAGFASEWVDYDVINQLDTVPQASLITPFEALLQEWQPSFVLIPSPSYNQDHRACYEAMLTACRPHDRNWVPKRVLIYEEPETLGAMRHGCDFRPQYFHELNLERKITLYETYGSQVRQHRSLEQVAALATIRGAQSQYYEHAEAFEVARWVD